MVIGGAGSNPASRIRGKIMSERKVKYKETITCPKCKAGIIVEIGDDIIIPAEPAEKEKYVQVELDGQAKLDIKVEVKKKLKKK